MCTDYTIWSASQIHHAELGAWSQHTLHLPETFAVLAADTYAM
ncbi:MAG: hypothetical protein AAFU78_08220 [Cyanobacteria bacterium J06633_2]